jgi:hypothetical protein
VDALFETADLGTEITVPYWESSAAAASPASGLRELM